MVQARITKIFTFDAAHSLPEHKGQCADLHGHTYRLEVTIARQNGELITNGSSAGMVMDFSDLKEIVNTEILEKVNHKFLNDVLDFRTTSENMSAYFYEVLQQKLVPIGVEVICLRLWETPTSYAEVGK